MRSLIPQQRKMLASSDVEPAPEPVKGRREARRARGEKARDRDHDGGG